ncbi:MAG: magnesium chelatase ATPase subunit D, partial [Alphaproteobacteria bacterium]
KGGTAVVVFLTDARANIDRAGNPDRAKAMEDALASARALSELQATVLFVDTAQRSQEPARVLASAMRATYLPLPFARSDGLADAVRAAAEA